MIDLDYEVNRRAETEIQHLAGKIRRMDGTIEDAPVCCAHSAVERILSVNQLFDKEKKSEDCRRNHRHSGNHVNDRELLMVYGKSHHGPP